MHLDRISRSLIIALVSGLTLIGGPLLTYAATAPYPPSSNIAGMSFDFSRLVRGAVGSDNWPLTWAADDHQYTSWGDGWGFDGGITKKSIGYSRIEGPATGWTVRDTYGSENAEAIATIGGKSYAILALGNTLYSFVSPGSQSENLLSARLYKSVDGGRTWLPTAVEFTSAVHGIVLPGFLQFGRGYAGARDSYVYAFWTRMKTLSWQTQKPGEIVLTRVPASSIETQAHYEFFAGLDGAGSPRWSPNLSDMRPVFTDPNGVLVNSGIYNFGLRRYLLVTNHTALDQGNVAVFDAPEPWGPWTTVAYHSGWPSGGEASRTTFYANFAPKWFSADGLGFVFVFTGVGSGDAWNSVPGSFLPASGGSDPDPDPVPEMAARWKLDEGSGATASDASGNGLSGALLSGASWTAGIFGSGILFDGVDDHVRIPDPGTGSPLDLRPDFTISAWVYLTSLPPVGSGRNPRLLQKGLSTSNPGSYYVSVSTLESPGKASLRFKFGGTTQTLFGQRQLSIGRWYHIAATKQGGIIRLYVDGIQDGGDFTASAGAPDENNEPLYLGESPDNSDGALPGVLDEIRIYTRALGAAEVAHLARRNGPPIVSAGPNQTITLPASVALAGSASDDGLPVESLTTTWTVTSGTGPVNFADPGAAETSAAFSSAGIYVLRLTAEDGQLRSYDEATITVLPGSGTTAPPIYSTHLSFDGANDHARIEDPGSGSALDLGSSFTVSAWVNFRSLPGSGAGRYPRLIQKGTNTYNPGSYYLAVDTYERPNVLALRLKFGGVAYTLHGTRSLSTGTWYHLAATKDGGVVRLYVDGAQDGGDHSVPSTAPDTADEPLFLGQSPGNGDGALAGAMDDLRIYRYALPAAEIARTMGSPLAGAEPGLAFYLPLNEGTGQILGDIGPDALSGHLGLTTAADSYDPAWGSASAALPAEEPALAPAGPKALPLRLRSPTGSAPVRISLGAPAPGVWDISVFDVQGRLVRRWSEEPLQGEAVAWDGRRGDGAPAPAGVYFVRVAAGSRSGTLKAILVRR